MNEAIKSVRDAVSKLRKHVSEIPFFARGAIMIGDIYDDTLSK